MSSGMGKRSKNSKRYNSRRRTLNSHRASRRLTAYSALPSPRKFLPVQKRSFMIYQPAVSSAAARPYRSVLPAFARDMQRAYVCARRKIRREVLFAVAPRGYGGAPRRGRSNKPPSNVRC